MNVVAIALAWIVFGASPALAEMTISLKGGVERNIPDKVSDQDDRLCRGMKSALLDCLDTRQAGLTGGEDTGRRPGVAPPTAEQLLKDAEALYFKGRALGVQGRHQEALRAFEEALDAFRQGARLRPDVPEIHRAIGVVLAHLGRYDEALRAYQEAVRLKPDFAQTYIDIAATLAHLGRKDEARRAYQEGVRLKPDLVQSYGYVEALLKPLKPITDPAERLQFQDFCILPPRGDNWSISSQGASHLRFTKGTTKGAHHIVRALVETESYSGLTFKSSTELLRHRMQLVEQDSITRGANPSKVSLGKCRGRDCVRVDFTVEHDGRPYAPGPLFILTGRELYFLHPDTPGVIVKLAYSQRFRRGEQPLPIEVEVRPFLKSLLSTPIRTEDKLAQELPGGTGAPARKCRAEPRGSVEEQSPKREASEKLLVEIDLSSGSQHSFRLSPDAKRVAYSARAGDKQFMVVDGQQGKPYENVHPPIFSPDSKRVTYAAREGHKWFVVVDGQEGKPYKFINARTLVFSPDGTRVAYTAQRSNKWFMVVDGQEGNPYDYVGPPIFSPDGKRVAYAARAGDKRFWFVVVDRQEGKPYENVVVGSPIFSPDSTRVAYAAGSGGKAFVVVDGQEGKPYDIIDLPRFSPDSKRVEYGAEAGGKRVVVVDGQEGKPLLCGPIFSPDRKRVAYGASVGGKQVVVVDGKEGEPFDTIPMYPFHFSPDSKRVAYTARVGTQWLVVVDGKEGNPYDRIVRGPIFSPDSKRVAYAAQVGDKWFVVVDEQAGSPYDTMGLRVFEARLIFDSANSLHYIAPRGNRVYFVEERIR